MDSAAPVDPVRIRAAVEALRDAQGAEPVAGTSAVTPGQLDVVRRLLERALARLGSDDAVMARRLIDEAVYHVVDEWPMGSSHPAVDAVMKLRRGPERSEGPDVDDARSSSRSSARPTGVTLWRATAFAIVVTLAAGALIVAIVWLSPVAPLGSVFAPLVASVASTIGVVVFAFREWFRDRPRPERTVSETRLLARARTARRLNYGVVVVHVPLIIAAAVLENELVVPEDPVGPAVGYAVLLVFVHGPAWLITMIGLGVYVTRPRVSLRGAVVVTWGSIAWTFLAGVLLVASTIYIGGPWRGQSPAYEVLLMAAAASLILGAVVNATVLLRGRVDDPGAAGSG